MADNGTFFYPSRMKFKVILCKTPPQRDRRRLEIPTRVGQEFFPGLVFLRTVLVDRFGESVEAILQRKHGKVYITDGWTEFYDAHSLRRGDSVLFSLRDDDILEVKCFCWCCMERDDFGKRERHGHEIPGSIFGEEENQNDGGYNAAEANNPNEVDAVQQNIEVEIDFNSNLIHCDEGVHVAAAQFRSQNKHFIRVLQRSAVARPFLMTFPASVASLFPVGKRVIAVYNTAGQQFDVTLVNDKHNHALSGGWQDFAVQNELSFGNTIVFEILDSTTIHLHMYR
ncbi:hypothetical protein COLO4_21439 [Corchorus olitorius]|uniref:TF-B3 domain-containing protein n=1 Tax=Corchorus olitorius TaxID=93759 RepID=A0A1R3IT91_9ROSI|nr:hypothetical protein COLO4_21439 [Corchorus olitorius]